MGKLQARIIKTASSLSFPSDLVRAVHARGRGKDARRAKRGHARGHLRVSRVLLDRLRKKRGCSQSTRNKATGISMWEDNLILLQVTFCRSRQVKGTGHCFIDSLVN